MSRDGDDGKQSASSAKVNVAVRVRPFNRREMELNSVCVVDMQDNQTILSTTSSSGKIAERKQKKVFAFDHCFWSMDPSVTDKFADQETVFEKLGTDLLKNVFSGYNACIFAYGQTGSGKSYTMMGSHTQPGLIPRLCTALFHSIQENSDEGQSFKVEVSYMEIYNEKVRDLLDPEGGSRHLKVREHKSLGPYVDGLQQLAVSGASDVQELMSEGNKSRTVAATKMNAESSRSHAVFTLVVTQTLVDLQSDVSGERVSKVSLVDLAGSERASKTGASGDRLKEGSNINKSLTTLGLVISSLADQASGKAKNKFVPYRDSALTWILKDNLGGNSRTAMVATISPSADNFEETLSTLRYADRAKRIVNKAVVNEDPNARIIRELREEVEKLQLQLKQSESLQAPELKEKLEQSEHLIKEISQTWEDKLRKTEEIHKQRQETLERMGLSLEKSGIKVEKTKCFLVNLNADPSLNELLVYYLKPKTVVGQSENSDMQLSGLGILDIHCSLEITEDGLVYLDPEENARTCINGRTVNSRTGLKHGDRILWGNNHFFRINIPKKSRIPTLISDRGDKAGLVEDGKLNPSDTDISLNESTIDYEFAQQEVLMNQVEVPLQETIMHLEKEFQELENESTYSRLDMDERNRYEEEIKALRQQLMSLSPRGSSDSLDRSSDAGGGNDRPKKELSLLDIGSETSLQYSAWKKERNNALHASVLRLRQDLVRAQAAAQEANYLSKEMKKLTEFIVSLQIPAHNLTPNRKRGTLLCEPAVQVIRNGRDSQVWSVEKLENRLVEMHDMYLDYKDGGSDTEFRPNSTTYEYDPFDETERNQVLIGVANVFLSCLLQSHPFRYPVPIINQHGKVAGKLIVEVHRISGSVNEELLISNNCDSTASDTSEENDGDIMSDLSSSGSSGIGSSLCIEALPATTFGQHQPDSCMDTSSTSITYSPSHGMSSASTRSSHRKMKCRITIVEALGLSSTLSHFVQCQYLFLDCPEVVLVPPDLSPEELSPKSSRSTLNIKFHHTMDFTCNVTEELMDRINSGSSLAVEVWGHRDRYNHLGTDEEISQNLSESKMRSSSLLSEKHKSLTERWSEVMKRIQVDVSILELEEDGEYAPVEIANKPGIQSRGIFQLKQGQSRRIHVAVEIVKNSGTLPLVIENISSLSAGSVQASKESLDSYSEIDLANLRKSWLDVLERRKEYLDQEIQLIANNKDKSLLEREREASLFDQWLTLTEERNALVSPHLGIPGAPAAWSPPESVEMHIPVVFLNIKALECENEFGHEVCGLDSLLPKELPETYIQLPIIRRGYDEAGNRLSTLASWDSSLHDCLLLNRVTHSDERVYVIIKICLCLSHPVEMQVILRKRICISIYKQRGFTALLRRRLHGKEVLPSSSLMCEVVSGIPLSSQDDEDQETLAILAASGAKSQDEDWANVDQTKKSLVKRNPFDLYVTRSMQSVDDILSLDRIRQQVALREIFDQNSNRQKNRPK